MQRPSSLIVFATVAGGGILGMLIYAGIFYANQRRSTMTAEAQPPIPSYPNQAKAEQASKRWIQEGGSFTVTTRQRVRRSIPLTRQELRKLEILADEKRRARIEADYESCLDKAATDLAKELCSFQQSPPLSDDSTAAGAGRTSALPTTKVVEDVRVQSREHPRRQCAPVTSYRRFNCLEFEVENNADLSPAEKDALEIRAYRQFRY